MADTKNVTKPPARERLLAAANELFYAEGVQSVGIDRVIEHAGVAKASLYNIYGGKEQLIRAYLDSHYISTTQGIELMLARHDTPRERLLSVFDAQTELFARPDFHGCAFVSASAEARPGGLVEQAADEFRAWVRSRFTSLATDAGVANPEALAKQLHLLYDGAGLSARMDRDPSAAVAARAAASALLDAALTSGRKRTTKRKASVTD